jgi:hypothetical protein
VQLLSLEERVKAFVAGDASRPVPILVFPLVNDPRFPDERPTKRNEVSLLVLDHLLHKLKAS